MSHLRAAAALAVLIVALGCGSDPSHPGPHSTATPIVEPTGGPSPVVPTATPIAPTPIPTATPTPAPTLAAGQWHLFELAPGIPVYAIDVDPGAPNVVLAGTGDGEDGFGVYISRDGGRSWQPDGLPNAAVVSLQFDPSGSGDAFALARAVCRRDPGGEGQWQVLDGRDPAGPPYTREATLAVGPGGDLLVQASANVFVSQDGGGTFRHVDIRPDESPYPCNNLHDVAIAPTDSSVVYVSNPLGLWASTNGGESWPPVLCGPTLTGRRYGIAVDPTSALIAYAGTGLEVRKTEDGGKTWTAREVGGVYTSAVVIDPVRPSTIYAGTGNGGVRVSRDGGRRWTSLGDFPDTAVNDLAINPTDGRTIFAATDAGVAVFVLP